MIAPGGGYAGWLLSTLGIDKSAWLRQPPKVRREYIEAATVAAGRKIVAGCERLLAQREEGE